MNNYERIISEGTTPICLYCGNPQKEKWEEYNRYFECDCIDAKLVYKLDKQINDLKRQYPKQKFKIEKINVLVKSNGK
jgi:hypothetical protein